MMQYFFILLIAALSAAIAWQDFKSREISAWLVYGFVLAAALKVFFIEGGAVLLSNFISSLLFIGLWSAVILLYYFLKEKKFSNFIDSKLGLADILILFGIGLSTELIPFILFVMSAAVITLVISLKLIRHDKSIPLAGIFVGLFVGMEVINALGFLPDNIIAGLVP